MNSVLTLQKVKMDCHLSSFTTTLKQGQDTMQLISLMVFRTDTWKRMVIRVIIISLVSGAAPAGRIQEDTSLMRFQKESSMITAIRQYRSPVLFKAFEYERRSHNKKHTFEQRKAYRLEKKTDTRRVLELA